MVPLLAGTASSVPSSSSAQLCPIFWSVHGLGDLCLVWFFFLPGNFSDFQTEASVHIFQSDAGVPIVASVPALSGRARADEH